MDWEGHLLNKGSLFSATPHGTCEEQRHLEGEQADLVHVFTVVGDGRSRHPGHPEHQGWVCKLNPRHSVTSPYVFEGMVSHGLAFLSLPWEGGREPSEQTSCSPPHPRLSPCRLGNCGLTAADCRDLASALISNQSLTHLCLSSNSLGREGVNLLCRAIKLPSCGLQRLM